MSYYTFPGKLMGVAKGGEERIKPIISEVCSAWRTTPEKLKTKRNSRDEFSEPFHVACALILEFTTVRRKDVAVMFSRKRCTTYHAQKTVRNLEFSNFEFRDRMARVRASLTNKFLRDESISNHLGDSPSSINDIHSEGCEKRLCECEG